MSQIALEQPKYLTISELTNILRLTLETEYSSINFEGEISGLKKATSGHIYLTLKDQNSQIPAVIWRNTVKLDFDIRDGVHVNCTGKVTLYPAQGKLQVVINKISEAGEGALQKKFLALKKKLEEEGLFAQSRKRPLPFLPRAVGVVTSDKGAVIKDIMVKIHERFPAMDVYLVPVRVQGKEAAEEIAAGIRILNRSGLVDVIIVGRGGGSLEDLWAFNEEVVVRTIFASELPIISAVGHETDISLSDLAADVRAPTPTAAAEMVVPRRNDLTRRIDELLNRITAFATNLETYWQRIDEMEMHFELMFKNLSHRKELQLKAVIEKVKIIEPANVISHLRKNLSILDERLAVKAGERVRRAEHSVSLMATKLEAINPKNVLKRGYSLVSCNGRVITDAAQLKSKDLVSLSFSVGAAEAEIKSIEKEDV